MAEKASFNACPSHSLFKLLSMDSWSAIDCGLLGARKLHLLCLTDASVYHIIQCVHFKKSIIVYLSHSKCSKR
jgi:hypothetical protein